MTEQYITTNGSDYISLNMSLSNRTWTIFQVRASSSATVGLTTEYMNYTTNYLYEIVLGLYGYTNFFTLIK